VQTIKRSAIVACASNRVIGLNNALPWHIPEDLQYFKRTTMGKPLIMGRRTFDSFGKPLPGRPHIVITRQHQWSYAGVSTAHSLAEGLALAESEAQALGVNEVMVIGGAEIYRQAMPLLDLLYVTEVQTEIEGDAWFPEINSTTWREVTRDGPYISSRNGLVYSFVIFQKRSR
jgi:dihydrofolate reductase